MRAEDFGIDDAIEWAARAHRGQRDKGRPTLPYLTHPMRVMSAFDDPVLQMIAILHDAVEDSDGTVTLELLRQDGAPERVLAGIAAMTHHDDESNEAYWSRERENPDALQVKLADVADNADPARVALLPDDQAQRLAAKYAAARRALTGSPAADGDD